MRVGRLLPVLLLGLVACGRGTTESVSTQLGQSHAAAPAANVSIAARWRVLKTDPGDILFKTGEVVEFHTDGTIASGPRLDPSPVTWQLDGARLVLRGGASVSYSVALADDVLRLVGGAGETRVLRRYLGPPEEPPAARAKLEEGQFLSLLNAGKIESATLTQTGTVITATGVYDGGESVQRYAVTLDDCKTVQSLAAAFRRSAVLTDGLAPSEVSC